MAYMYTIVCDIRIQLLRFACCNWNAFKNLSAFILHLIEKQAPEQQAMGGGVAIKCRLSYAKIFQQWQLWSGRHSNLYAYFMSCGIRIEIGNRNPTESSNLLTL